MAPVQDIMSIRNIVMEIASCLSQNRGGRKRITNKKKKEIMKKFIGSKDRLIKLNMADYMEPHSVAKLIGGVPG